MASATCIYYVSSANISINGNGFALYKINWVITPLGTSTVLVQYRKQGDVTWINVSTNLQVDISGNIEDSVLDILTTAEYATYYEIRLVNQCGSLEYIQTFYFPEPLNSGSYLVDNMIYNICGNDAVVYFSDIPFDTGAFMFTDVNLITPLTGFSYIANGNGIIYNLNSSTGEVGAATAYECNATVTTSGQLANGAANTCSAAILNLYSDETPQVGTFLFTDQALSIPATGFTHVKLIEQVQVYTVNNGTGEILATDATICTSNAGLYQYAPVMNDVYGSEVHQLYTSGSFGKGAIMYTDYAMTTPLTGQNFIAENNSGIIYTISTTTGLVGCIAVEC